MWKDEVLKKEGKYQFIDSVYTQGLIEGDQYLDVSNKEGGTDFFTRTKIKGTHSYFDTKIIYHHLKKIFSKEKYPMIMDIGCGDGRVTIWLLENTKAKIIAVDGSLNSLLKLKKNYLDNNPGYAERVLLVHSNVLDIPVRDGQCDCLWCFEVWCYLLDQAEKAVEESFRILKEGGALICGERTKDFGLLHELLNDGPEGILETNQTNVLIDQWNQSKTKSRVFLEEEMRGILQEKGFHIQDMLGVSFFPVMTSFLRSKGYFSEEIVEKAEELSDLFIECSESNFMKRSFIFISKK